MSDYWLGVVTLPVLALISAASVAATLRSLGALKRRGITFSLKGKRSVDRISDYTLRHNIWWERARGPVFAGGWYRDRAADGRRRINRWVGVGRPNGPCVIVYRSRDLGEGRDD